MTTTSPPPFLHRMWDMGEQHLAAGRYMAARRDLEAAEAIAWRDHDAPSLARLYLPLLEARRQIRYLAVEGTLLISPLHASIAHEQALLHEFLECPAGTVLISCTASSGKSSRHKTTGANEPAGCRFAGSVHYEASRTGRWLEALLLVERGNEVRIASQADPTFSAGIPVRFTTDPADQVGSSSDPALVVPLPPPAEYRSSGAQAQLHALARESLITAWEALALRWQHRHPPPGGTGWDEIAWLRLALRIDPACEPIAMRIMALAESIARP